MYLKSTITTGLFTTVQLPVTKFRMEYDMYVKISIFYNLCEL